MTYTCQGCGFIFSRTAMVTKCPSCEQGGIRPATEQEIKEFEQKLKKIEGKMKVGDTT